MKNIVLLGSTGSVGRNVLEIVRCYPDRFNITALSARDNLSLLEEQIKEFKPDSVVIGNESAYSSFKNGQGRGIEVLFGEEGLRQVASSDADIVFMAISGTAALSPLVEAVKAGKTVALASKEPIVSAGEIIMRMAAENASKILPVDSEHSAIAQCMASRNAEDVGCLYITGSGGTLWGKEAADFDNIPLEDILAHPKWDMGRKITVDSATLMNKGLEIIEARWLFDIVPEKIKVVIHPEAIIHSMVEFVDGSITAGLFSPDMRFPILKALAHPCIVPSDLPRVDLVDMKNLSFYDIDAGRVSAVEMAFESLRRGGTMPAVLNGANEAAVQAFLDGCICFSDIMKKVRSVMDLHIIKEDPTLDDIINAERWAKEEVLSTC